MARTAVLLLAAAGLAGCGGQSTVGDKGGGAAQSTLRDPDVTFTFAYPAGFAAARPADLARSSALAIVGPTADGFIAVRLHGPRPLGLAALERQARAALGGKVVAARRETHAGIPMVAVTVADFGGAALGLRSTVYAFTQAGRTWLLECHSGRRERATIAVACRRALATLRPAEGAPAGPPTVSVAPARTRHGARVTISGTGWPARATVRLLAGPPRSEAALFAAARTGPHGAFRLTTSLPRGIPGRRIVVLACRRGCRVKAADTVAVAKP